MRTNARTMQKTTGCLSIYLEIFCFLTAMMLECLLSSTRPKIVAHLMAPLTDIAKRRILRTLAACGGLAQDNDTRRVFCHTSDGPCGWISGFEPGWWVPIAHPLFTSLQVGRVFNRTVI